MKRSLLSAAVPTQVAVSSLAFATEAGAVATSPPSFPPASGAAQIGQIPAQIAHAYGFDKIYFNGIKGDGAGTTIAIIDAYRDPNIASDLHQFDVQLGLSDPPNFTEVDELGQHNLPVAPPSTDPSDWITETALDVEWAHAMAPGASILLVEANSDLESDIKSAIATARTEAGVDVVSMSFGTSEYSQETTSDTTAQGPGLGIHPVLINDGDFNSQSGHGVTFVAAAGGGAAPQLYPAASPSVLSVGGTSLYLDNNNNIVQESPWSGSGGGSSSFEAQPPYQIGVVTPGTTQRTTPDVAYDADPNTGFWVYNSYGTTTPWHVVGGTDAGAPQWAALIAIADQGRALLGAGSLDGATQTLPMLYSMPARDFNNITTGTSLGNANNSTGTGYESATGLGSPVANLVVDALLAKFTSLDVPGAWSPQAVAVSGSNVVGDYLGPAPHAFLYNTETSTYTTIGPLEHDGLATTSEATGVSGNYAVGNYLDTDGHTKFFVYNIAEGTWPFLQDPYYSPTAEATGISGNNVVGYYAAGDGQTEGFVFDIATSSYITTSIDSMESPTVKVTGVSGDNVVGYYDAGGGRTVGFVYDASTGAYVNTSINPSATLPAVTTGISGSLVVGYNTDANDVHYAFQYNLSSSTYTLLTPPESTSAMANSVSGNFVVGQYQDASGAIHGFLYNGNGSTYSMLDQPGSQMTKALGVSGDSIVGTYTDGGGTTHGFESYVMSFNLPALLTGTNPVTYYAAQPAKPIDTTITVSDTSSATLASATVTLSIYVAGQDSLGFANDGSTMGNITGSFSNGTLTLNSAGATATLAQWQAALRAVTYFNSSFQPNTAQRQVVFQVSDGFVASSTLTTAISVKAPPYLAGNSSISYLKQQTATPIDTAITLNDPSSNTLASATGTLTNYVSGQDQLAFKNNGTTMGNISGIFSNGTLTLTSAGSTATLAQWQAALRAVTYHNSSATPKTTLRQVTFQVNDGSAVSNVLTSTINVIGVKHAPVLAGTSTLSYTTGQAAAAIDATITVTDAESPTLASATIKLTNYVAGQDVLAFANDGRTVGNITGSFSNGTLTLTSAGSTATLDEWQAALRAVTYLNTSSSPNKTLRHVTFQVSDGAASSNTLTSTVQIH